MNNPVKIFIAYAHEDTTLLTKLRTSLNPIERQGHCRIFYDGKIAPGERWDDRLKTELHKADLILLLLSPGFLVSDYVNKVELPKALELERLGKARVVPILLVDCLYEFTELKDLQIIMDNGDAISEGQSYTLAARKVGLVIGEIHSKWKREADEQAAEHNRLIAEQNIAVEAALLAEKQKRESEAGHLAAIEEQKRIEHLALKEAEKKVLAEKTEADRRTKAEAEQAEYEHREQAAAEQKRHEAADRAARERAEKEIAADDLKFEACIRLADKQITFGGRKTALRHINDALKIYPDNLLAQKLRLTIEAMEPSVLDKLTSWEFYQIQLGFLMRHSGSIKKAAFIAAAVIGGLLLIREILTGLPKQTVQQTPHVEPPPISAEKVLTPKKGTLLPPYIDVLDFGRFILVEKGSFDMGYKVDRDLAVNARDSDDTGPEPSYNVLVDSFYILEHEVTLSQWESVMGSRPRGTEHFGKNFPVSHVWWTQAVAFTDSFSNKHLYKVRLPKEAEWELAARGGVNKLKDFHFSGSNWPDSVAWTNNIKPIKPRQIKMKKPNQLGIYDMSGNVSEWCLDDGWRPDQKIVRGGSWETGYTWARIPARLSKDKNKAFPQTGFRVIIEKQNVEHIE